MIVDVEKMKKENPMYHFEANNVNVGTMIPSHSNLQYDTSDADQILSY